MSTLSRPEKPFMSSAKLWEVYEKYFLILDDKSRSKKSNKKRFRYYQKHLEEISAFFSIHGIEHELIEEDDISWIQIKGGKTWLGRVVQKATEIDPDLEIVYSPFFLVDEDGSFLASYEPDENRISLSVTAVNDPFHLNPTFLHELRHFSVTKQSLKSQNLFKALYAEAKSKSKLPKVPHKRGVADLYGDYQSFDESLSFLTEAITLKSILKKKELSKTRRQILKRAFKEARSSSIQFFQRNRLMAELAQEAFKWPQTLERALVRLEASQPSDSRLQLYSISLPLTAATKEKFIIHIPISLKSKNFSNYRRLSDYRYSKSIQKEILATLKQVVEQSDNKIAFLNSLDLGN